MDRYLIEIPHDSDSKACTKVVRTFLSSGSHFLSNADWGCKDGDHRAFLVVELGSREEAQAIVPPAFRPEARIVRLVKFGLDADGRVQARNA
jgi:hypothetical protein